MLHVVRIQIHARHEILVGPSTNGAFLIVTIRRQVIHQAMFVKDVMASGIFGPRDLLADLVFFQTNGT